MIKSKKYKVSIIGAGNIASRYDNPDDKKILTHAHAVIRNDKFELLGFFDCDSRNREIAASKWKTEAFETIYDACSSADIVCCCVPDEFHYDILKAIVEFRPRLIIAEKPLALSIEEAWELKNIFNKTGVPVALNYSRRYIPDFQQIRDDYKQNKYGRLIKGVGYYGKGMFHNGGHLIDLLTFIFSCTLEILEVKNSISDFGIVDKTYDAEIKVADGIIDLIGVDSRICTVLELDMMFEKARIRIVDGGSNIEIYSVGESKDYKGYYNYQKNRDVSVDYSMALCGLYQNVANYLNHTESLMCSIDDGINVIRVCSDIRENINE